MKSVTCLFFAFVTACMGLIASSFSSEITYLLDPQAGGLTPSPEPWRTVILAITVALTLTYLFMAAYYLVVPPPREDDWEE